MVDGNGILEKKRLVSCLLKHVPCSSGYASRDRSSSSSTSMVVAPRGRVDCCGLVAEHLAGEHAVEAGGALDGER